MESQKVKKPLYKKWWFWVIVLVVAGVVIRGVQGDSRAPIEYTIIGQTEYARDGKLCIGYNVEIGDGATEEDMRAAFSEITSDDGYYLHTIWFYGMASDVANVGFYTAGMLQEESKSDKPTYSAPMSQEEIARARAEASKTP